MGGILELTFRMADPAGRAELGLLIGIRPESNYEEDDKLGYRRRDSLYFWDDKQHPPTTEKPDGVIRVFALGDSFTKAHGKIGRENSFYHQVEYRLKEVFSPSGVQFFHFGVSGYCQRQQLELVRHYGPVYKPDIIVVQVYLGNDVGENSGIILRHLQFQGERLAISDIYRVPVTGKEATSTSLLEALAEQSYFARFLFDRLTILGWKWGISQHVVIPGSVTMNHTLDLMRHSPPPYIEKAWQITETLVDQIKKASEVLGAKVIFLLVPKEVQVNTVVSDRVMRDFKLDPEGFDFDQINRRFSQILARHNIEYVDLTPVFRELITAGEVMYDGHFNKAGHRVVGQVLYSAFVDRGLVP
jgi:hypothetical protein